MRTLGQAAGIIVLFVAVAGYLAALACAFAYPLDLNRRR